MLRFDEGQIYKSCVHYSREGDGGGTLWSKANNYQKYTASAVAIENRVHAIKYECWVASTGPKMQ